MKKREENRRRERWKVKERGGGEIRRGRSEEEEAL